jgi:adenylyltransferase/sulfurtransferase
VGLAGLIQAAEVLKHLAGVGESLEGALLVFDALSMAFRRTSFRRRPECPLCGEAPTIKTLVESGGACDIPQS